jgi:hypothetical protein
MSSCTRFCACLALQPLSEIKVTVAAREIGMRAVSVCVIVVIARALGVVSPRNQLAPRLSRQPT